ncbi:hypothetical protein T10_6030 [Trichinella papuae]|uniref:Uncharacterized protein n=1 Tax=Trichinella papuae TaxID=268474 RepID=A0A0V1MR32_9BILA|nr:hypothetical protein T10_6030 [Trichinella papuae]
MAALAIAARAFALLTWRAPAWLVICKISLQWHRPLKAVLAYALALRGGGSGLELTLHVLINVAWRR